MSSINSKGSSGKALDPTALRSRLEQTRGKEYWRSLEELAGTDEFLEFLRNEFPRQSGLLSEGLDRRQVLKLMGASLALAGLAGCAHMPTEKILPYVKQPEELVPGEPLFFATAMPLGGFGKGLVVESHLGRPTKIEGNPQHPGSLGATDAFGQASVLTLYDPDRSQTVLRLGNINTWVEFIGAVNEVRADQQIKKGAGLRVLTETVTSPTLAYQLQQLLAEFPLAEWHQYEPVGRDNLKAGARLAFGEMVDTIYRFDQADVILSLESDFLFAGPGCVRYARDFAGRRRMGDKQTDMNRLYVVESSPSVTGSVADHRLRIRSSNIEALAWSLGKEAGVLPAAGDHEPSQLVHGQWIEAVVRDLQRHRGSSVVLAGEQQPPFVHALCHALNDVFGNVGKTVIYTDPVESNPVNQMQSLRELVSDMKSGRVDTLFILSGNPVFTAPVDLEFGEALSRIKLGVHLGLYEDETSQLCHWHVPETHYLEAWGDVRAYEGTISIIQPLIAPLYGGKSAHEVLATLQGHPTRSSYEIVQDYWKNRGQKNAGFGPKSFKESWEIALYKGFIEGTGLPQKPVSVKKGFEKSASTEPRQSASATAIKAAGSRPLEIVFRPDPTIWDGRFANNGWLQELPKPMSKLTWDNVMWISPATAARLGINQEDVVRLLLEGREVNAPAWIMPGHADDSVTVHFGYGSTLAGRVGAGTGFNAYLLRTSGHPWMATGVELQRTGEQSALAITNIHHSMEGRDFVRVATLEEFRKNPRFAQEMNPAPPPGATLYPEVKDTGYAWGMAINLNSCIGCNACVVACQAENNIPVVGKDQVRRSREMHWIRIDHYFHGSLDDPEIYNEPVMCMHCENAPCELVCPVGATNHSAEGLNQMIYNRCVGTRYCSNNCPYKVRRFNFYQLGDWETPSLKLQRNPNVTVRSRGVMEKCSYCVQRINAAKIDAEKQDRKVRDGEIVTACQAACPTEAIVFGDINDPNSHVSRLKAQTLNYGLLTELTTHPRTTYLAKVRNPNPEIEES
ncbi:MAG: TAT-variant-translocated molybdopterin oxidoreductase [Terriglobia bacterium]